SFFDKTQEVVTGSVTMSLYKGTMAVKSRISPFSLYRQDIASFDTGTYNHHDAEGFINLLGLPAAVRSRLMVNQYETMARTVCRRERPGFRKDEPVARRRCRPPGSRHSRQPCVRACPFGLWCPDTGRMASDRSRARADPFGIHTRTGQGRAFRRYPHFRGSDSRFENWAARGQTAYRPQPQRSSR